MLSPFSLSPANVSRRVRCSVRYGRLAHPNHPYTRTNTNTNQMRRRVRALAASRGGTHSSPTHAGIARAEGGEVVSLVSAGARLERGAAPPPLRTRGQARRTMPRVKRQLDFGPHMGGTEGAKGAEGDAAVPAPVEVPQAEARRPPCTELGRLWRCWPTAK